MLFSSNLNASLDFLKENTLVFLRERTLRYTSGLAVRYFLQKYPSVTIHEIKMFN